MYIYILCVCFRCHDISKHVLPHPEHREQKRTGSKPSSPPHVVVRRGLWIISCRFSSGSVQNEISVAMFFVVPSVTLLSLKIYIYMEKKTPFKQIMFRFAGFPMNFPYKSKNLQGELQCCWLNHVESLYSIVKPPGCC